MQEAGLTYVEACRAYEAMIAAFEDAVVTGNRVSLGRVGALMPKWHPPRTVVMGCRRLKGGGVVAQRREYNLGQRLKYRFNLHRTFVNRHQLRWFV